MGDVATVTAAQVRRDAITRLVVAADGHRSFGGPYDPDRMRPESIDLLYRWALANAHAAGELDTARVELDRIYPIARTPASGVDEVIAAGGLAVWLGEQTVTRPTLDELEAALTRIVEEARHG